MIKIKDALKVRITLVVKLDDFITHSPVSADGMIVVSGDGLLQPVVKPGGYFVFTSRRPNTVRIASRRYGEVLLNTDGYTQAVLRLSLVPSEFPGTRITLDGEAHVGFGSNGSGYVVTGALAPSTKDIMLQKDDFLDITDMFHVLVTQDGVSEAVYITENKANGAYRLMNPPLREYPAWGARLVPLYRVIGGDIPVPSGADTVYILSGDSLSAKKLEVAG